jgi:hypothetical protein
MTTGRLNPIGHQPIDDLLQGRTRISSAWRSTWEDATALES